MSVRRDEDVDEDDCRQRIIYHLRKVVDGKEIIMVFEDFSGQKRIKGAKAIKRDGKNKRLKKDKEEEEEECCICYEDKHPVPWLRLDCGHEFHRDCVKKWVKKDTSCPLCRKPQVYY